MKVPAKVLARAKKIKLLATDVDGVLTGGEIIILNSGEELKIWSVKDRMGFAMLRNSGLDIPMAWITARGSEQVQKRAEELRVRFIKQKCTNKWDAVKDCMVELNIKADEVAFLGDDYVDLPALRRVGFSVCPSDAPDLVQKSCFYKAKAAGGKGVMREVIEIILQAQGVFQKVMQPFLGILLGLVFLSGCWNSLSQKSSKESPDQWIEKFTITETAQGVPTWILNAETAEVYQKRGVIELEDARISFLTQPSKNNLEKKNLATIKDEQTTRARLTAPQGEVNMQTHDLYAHGGVEVESQDGVIIYSEDLRFSNQTQKIYTDSAVKVVRKDSVLFGEGLEANSDLTEIKILRHRAYIYPKEVASK